MSRPIPTRSALTPHGCRRSTANRKLFAATLFPVVPTPGADLAEPDQEAETYDDGFAQIVHSHQPPTIDAATGSTDGIQPGAEAGIQLAWDDEQVTIWLDRQVGLLRDRANNTATNPEAPLGVLGYRVDVRQSGTTAWQSLCAVTGSLPFSGATATGTGTTAIGAGDELFVTPSPVRAQPTGAGPSSDPGWLPLYFTAWRGASLVAHDTTITKLSPGTTAMPANALQPVLPTPPRYGDDYDFRIRLADLTGGGPVLGDNPVHPGLAPIATCPFRRYIPPKALEVATTPAPPPLPAKPAAVRTIIKLAVRRPRIGYPEALFAGVSPATFQGAAFDTLIAQAKASGRALGVPDPDVDRFRVTVEAAIPDHDTGTAGTLPGDLDGVKWRIVYSIVENFPAGADPTLTLALSYTDVPDIAAMTPPTDNAPTLPIPTARDIRIRLTPLSAVKSNYYGTPTPPDGLVTDYVVRKEAASEANLFPFVPAQQLRACWLQPGGDLAALVAQSFGLTSTGLTLSGVPGTRTVFAASGALRATLSPDRSTLTFANAAELLDHWIVALTIDLARDWTWEGFAGPALSVTRNSATIGTLVFPTVIGPDALGTVAHPADRTTTQLVFLDAISPQPGPGGFPNVLNPAYAVTASFPAAPAIHQSWTTLRLPITTNPAQTPKIVSTGIAESPYAAASDYSSTELRDRYLWVELDAPIADTADDNYFGRVLAYGPDPLLAGGLLPPEHAPDTDPEPPLAIDAETVRVVFAGEDADESGLDAMTPLIRASATTSGPDGVHFLLPLPPGIAPDALDLFGFWTYEFRVGHAEKWSTAQGRFGRPLRVAGVQHPAPRLDLHRWAQQDRGHRHRALRLDAARRTVGAQSALRRSADRTLVHALYASNADRRRIAAQHPDRSPAGKSAAAAGGLGRAPLARPQPRPARLCAVLPTEHPRCAGIAGAPDYRAAQRARRRDPAGSAAFPDRCCRPAVSRGRRSVGPAARPAPHPAHLAAGRNPGHLLTVNGRQSGIRPGDQSARPGATVGVVEACAVRRMIKARGMHNTSMNAPRMKKLLPAPQRSAIRPITGGTRIEVSRCPVWRRPTTAPC